jgi:hypothetical protein
MSGRTPGYHVKLKDGREGRTYHSKGEINGKIPVYLCEEFKDVGALKICTKYKEQAILKEKKDLEIIGFID